MPVRLLTAGESHGPSVTAIIEGLPAGLPLSPADINPDLARRPGLSASGKPYSGASPRMKLEHDTVEILGGVMAGRTIGAPIALQVRNLDHAKWQARAVAPMTVPRPGHADLTGALKYGYSDLRLSLGRASARVEDRLRLAGESDMNCPSPSASEAMRARVQAIMQDKDTLGGVFEVVVLGVPPGLGSHVHWDRRLSGRLAGALMSIHAMKGVEIGSAFANARLPGTQVHDEIVLAGYDGALGRRTNRAGGLEGGITTGQPLMLRVAMKPISTTLNPLQSVDLATGKAAPTDYERSDFCAVPRAGIVGEAMVCLVLADALLEKIGGDSLDEMRPRFESLRRARLDDLAMLNQPTVFWP